MTFRYWTLFAFIISHAFTSPAPAPTPASAPPPPALIPLNSTNAPQPNFGPICYADPLVPTKRPPMTKAACRAALTRMKDHLEDESHNGKNQFCPSEKIHFDAVDVPYSLHEGHCNITVDINGDEGQPRVCIPLDIEAMVAAVKTVIFVCVVDGFRGGKSAFGEGNAGRVLVWGTWSDFGEEGEGEGGDGGLGSGSVAGNETGVELADTQFVER